MSCIANRSITRRILERVTARWTGGAVLRKCGAPAFLTGPRSVEFLGGSCSQNADVQPVSPEIMVQEAGGVLGAMFLKAPGGFGEVAQSGTNGRNHFLTLCTHAMMILFKWEETFKSYTFFKISLQGIYLFLNLLPERGCISSVGYTGVPSFVMT